MCSSANSLGRVCLRRLGGTPPDPPRFEREAGPRVAKAKVAAYEHQLKGIIIEYNKSRALTKVNIDEVGNYKARS